MCAVRGVHTVLLCVVGEVAGMGEVPLPVSGETAESGDGFDGETSGVV